MSVNLSQNKGGYGFLFLKDLESKAAFMFWLQDNFQNKHEATFPAQEMLLYLEHIKANLNQHDDINLTFWLRALNALISKVEKEQ